MGMSFTTAHIYNTQNLTKAQFKKAFTDVMKAKGYTASDEENAALTYTLVFAPDRKWVTVLTDGSDARREAAELAKGLKAYAVMIDLVDSDFAELLLFDEAGAHKDTLTLGNSYLEDAAPMGDPAAWQPLLSGSWEQVREIQNSSYTFAEDALAHFAPLIGMDSKDILLDNDSAADDNNAVVLYFKKTAEKKLTLRSAFKKYFGDLLIPLGFKYITIKKESFYYRLINNEILQLISFTPSSSRKKGYNEFSIQFYITPLYGRVFPESEYDSQVFYRSLEYMNIINDPISQLGIEFCKNAIKIHRDHFWTDRSFSWSDIPSERLEQYILNHIDLRSFYFSPDYFDEMEIAKDCAKKIVVPIFEKVNNIERCIDFYYMYQYSDLKSIDLDRFSDRENFFNVSLMLILADYRNDISVYIDNEANKRLDSYNRGSVYLDGANSIEEHLERFREQQKEMIAIRDKILDTSELKERAIKMAEEFKANNITKLSTLGITT